MFFIVNTTKQSLSISDLKLILGPRQGTDLDVRYTREQAEKSKGLKSLISKGLISVKNKTEPVVESRFIKEVHTHNHNEFDAEKMKKDIMDGLKEAIAESIPSQPKVQSQPDINMEELAKMIVSMIPQGKTQNISLNEEDVKVDDNTISDIHSRAVNKIIKNVDSSNILLQEEIKKSDLDNNVDELEGMLG